LLYVQYSNERSVGACARLAVPARYSPERLPLVAVPDRYQVLRQDKSGKGGCPRAETFRRNLAGRKCPCPVEFGQQPEVSLAR